jgi:hypothetical protein
LTQQVLFEPASDWTPPEVYPRLSDEKVLVIDVETNDPNLRDKGPGWKRDDGEIVGFAIGTLDREWYFPTKHLGGGNLDHGTTVRWLKPLLANPGITKVFFNASYDFGWLEHDVGPVRGRVVCTQAGTALLNENLLRYNLDSCAAYFGVEGKNEELLRRAAATFGIDPKKDMWKLHSRYVGRYGEGDIKTTRGLYKKQIPKIKEDSLEKLWELEMDLIPLSVENS